MDETRKEKEVASRQPLFRAKKTHFYEENNHLAW